ncbi:MAG TPA: FtsX-like permease family protein, partial [Actinomycetes bacterium]|nr:FtsX-like permease family protein [Actinomycetes bacterium]
EFDYADPMAAGLVRQLRGRAPASPSEVAITEKLAERSGLSIDDTLRLPDADVSLRIVGIVREPDEWNARTAYTLPGAVIDALRASTNEGEAGAYSSASFLVDASTPVSWPQVMAFNAEGFVVWSRTVMLDPPPANEVPLYQAFGDRQPRGDSAVIVGVVVAAGMALLEVVLLAGPAFAVGARRARRQLAILAAVGAARAHLRDVVLAQGVVLGLVGGLVGTIGGVGLSIAGMPLVEAMDSRDYPPPDLRPLELALLVGVGLVTAVLAAAVPAWQASRQEVVQALAGRRGQRRTSRRVPLLGLALAGGGTTLAAYGAVERSANAILGGSMIAEVGLVLCTPTLVGWFGRFAPQLPLAPRIALRDAARNRMRSAPAVAAVMAAVAGSVAIGGYVTSLSHHNEAIYVPQAVVGQTVLRSLDGDADLAPALEVARQDLSVTDVLEVHTLGAVCPGDGGCTMIGAATPEANLCPGDPRNSAAPIANATPAGPVDRTDWRCRPAPFERFGLTSYVVASEDLATLTGAHDARAEQVLRAGGVVVTDPRLIHNGQATLAVDEISAAGQQEHRIVEVPAELMPEARMFARAILAPELAQRLDGVTRLAHVVLTTAEPASPAQEQALRDHLAGLSLGSFAVDVERGYTDDYAVGLLALLGAAALITIGTAGIATGLAITDARPDLQTLAAVGAAPGARRRLGMAQSGVITVLGTLLGTAAGLVPAAAVVYALGHVGGVPDDTWSFALPWMHVGVTAVVVPLIAVLAAGLFVRSRIAIERRPG